MFEQRLPRQLNIGASLLALVACEEGSPGPNPLPGDSIPVFEWTVFCPDSVAPSVDTVEMRVDSFPIGSLPEYTNENRHVWFRINNFSPDSIGLVQCRGGELRAGLDRLTSLGWEQVTAERCVAVGEVVFLARNGCVSSVFLMDPADTGQYRLFVSRVFPPDDQYRAPFTVP